MKFLNELVGYHVLQIARIVKVSERSGGRRHDVMQCRETCSKGQTADPTSQELSEKNSS